MNNPLDTLTKFESASAEVKGFIYSLPALKKSGFDVSRLPVSIRIVLESVLRNCAVNKSTLHIDKPGRHTLRIRVGDPGIVLQKIVLDFGGMKRSYLGPQSTLIE